MPRKDCLLWFLSWHVRTVANGTKVVKGELLGWLKGKAPQRRWEALPETERKVKSVYHEL
jgi:hypothetical protein